MKIVAIAADRRLVFTEEQVRELLGLTGVGEEPETARGLEELFEPGALGHLLDMFHLATGMGVFAARPDGTIVFPHDPERLMCAYCRMIRATPAGRSRCQADIARGGQYAARLGSPYIFLCHAGLVEWSAPILVNGVYLGSMFCGGVAMWPTGDTLARQDHEKLAQTIAVPVEELHAAALTIPQVEAARVQAAAEMLFVMVNYLSRTALLTLWQQRAMAQQQELLAALLRRRQASEPSTTAKGRAQNGAGIDVDQESNVHRVHNVDGVDSYGRHNGQGRSTYPWEIEEQLLARVRKGERAEAKRLLNRFLGEILFACGSSMEVMKARLLELVVVASRAAVEGGANLDRLLGINLRSLQQLNNCTDFEQICYWVVEAFDQFLDAVYESEPPAYSEPVKKALRFIDTHYAEDLRLETVARAVYLSPTYLTHLLKEETGLSFLEVLTRRRVQAAKQLLLQPGISIRAVAEQVGYKDPGYFARVFKRALGITPTQYQARHAARDHDG